MTLLGDVAQPPHFVAVGGDGAGQDPGLVGRRLQRGVGGGGALRAAGASLRARGQLAAAEPRQQRAQAEGEGEAADRRLRAGPRRAACCRPARRPIAAGRLLRRAPAARSSSAAISPAPAPARSEPSASRPLPAAPSASPPRSSRDRAGGAAQAGAEPLELLRRRRRPSAVELAAERAQRRGARAAIGAGPITARTPGCGGDPALPAGEQGEVARVVIGPRSVAATRTKGASQPGPTARVDRFRVLRAPGSRSAARRSPGRRW